MCTSIVSNRNKTLVGWNLDILDMEYRVTALRERVTIDICDKAKGWLPLFGANSRGDFVAMPTCWPYDSKSDPGEGCRDILEVDMDLLLERRTFRETRELAARERIASFPGVTWQAQLSDREGNVLQIIPGQGYLYRERPKYSVLTNFSPFKGRSEEHPWMGWDRYHTAVEMLEKAGDSLDAAKCFEILRATAQTACPTVVSMVFDPGENVVLWCENREWDRIREQKMDPRPV